MAPCVLVHGAWHYGELWNPVRGVRQLLEIQGHEVHTPTAGGLGKGDDVDRTVSHNQCWHPLAQYIEDNDLRDIILLGHSWGGSLISKVAEVHHDRIRRLVYFAAFVFKDGNSLMDEIPPVLRDALNALAKERDDGAVMLPFNIWREMFIQDADLELTRSTYERLAPQPMRGFADKVDLRKFYKLETPRSYINCTEDNCITQDPT